MIPLAAGLILAQAGFQAYQGYKNDKEADRLAKLGPQDPTPIAFRQMQANQANQANNSQVAGYGQIMDNMNEQQSSALGEAKRAGVSSSNLLNVLTRLNQQRQKGVRDLGIAGAEAQQQRQNQLNSTLVARGQYQEQGRQENARAIGALTGASKQNYFNAITSGVGAAGAIGVASDAAKASEATTQQQIAGVRQNVSDIPTTPDPNELGDMGGSNTMEPTPEMAGLANPYINMNQSVPDPYVYQPQGTNTYTPKMYTDYYNRKKYAGNTFR